MTAAVTRTGLTPKLLFMIVAVAEMVTWALLITAMILKYGFDIEALMFIAGLSHGTAFVSYALVSAVVGLNQRWRPLQVLLGIALAAVPFATLPWDRWLNRRGMLEGSWRREAGDDPRDQSVIDRTLRFGLRHPIASLVAIAAAVAIIITVMLQLGPPTQWFA